jgi:hypothetical protein
MVVHGTVITLFVAQVALIEPFEFWQQLGLPSFVVIDLLHKRLQEIVNSLNTAS